MTLQRSHPSAQPALSIMTPIAKPTRASVPGLFYIRGLDRNGVRCRLLPLALMLVCAAGLSGVMAAAVGAVDLQQSFASAHHGKPVNADLVGRPFQISVQFGKLGAASGGQSSSQYIEGGLRLSLKREEAGRFADPPHPALLLLRTQYASAGSFRGQTSRGMRVRVAVRSDETDALALISAPETDLIPATEFTPATHLYTYMADFPMSKAEAARLAPDVEAIIAGRAALLPDHKVYECDTSFYGATVDAPVDVHGHRCWIAADVQRLWLRRRSPGQTPKEWTAPHIPTGPSSDAK